MQEDVDAAVLLCLSLVESTCTCGGSSSMVFEDELRMEKATAISLPSRVTGPTLTRNCLPCQCGLT
jgi:hypothetical protein